MIEIDAGQLLSAAQQLELTKLAVMAMLISIILMFAVTVFALVVFGRKSSQHAAERERLNTDWQATMKDMARQLTEEFTPLVNTIGRVVLAVGELQRDITGSVDGLSSNVSSVASQVSELVTSVGRLRESLDTSEQTRQQRYDELFKREADTASRMNRIELELGNVRNSVETLSQKVILSDAISPTERQTFRQLVDAARDLLSKYGGQIERLKEGKHEQHETIGSDLPAGSGADGAADGSGSDGGRAGNAGDLPDQHGGRDASDGRDGTGADTGSAD
jgi:hypothetical protein